MGTELMRHINILKSVDEIKKSIEELKFGCCVEMGLLTEEAYRFQTIIKGEDLGMYSHIEYSLIDSKGYIQKVSYNEIFEIIGQVHEGHLRMFLVDKNYYGIITTTGRFGKMTPDNLEIYSDDLKLDNIKPYMEQSEWFFKKLNDKLEILINNK